MQTIRKNFKINFLRTALVLLLIVTLSIPQTAGAAETEEENTDIVSWLMENNIITDAFDIKKIKSNPDARISRQAFTAMLMLAAGETGLDCITEEPLTTVSTVYTDGYKFKPELSKYLNTAYILGVMPVVTESETAFGVKNRITNQMAAYYIGRCLNMHIDLELDGCRDYRKVNDICKPYVTALVSEGIMSTDYIGRFNPRRKLTWQTAGELIKRIYEAGYFDFKYVNVTVGSSPVGKELKPNEFLTTGGISKNELSNTLYITDTNKNQIKSVKNKAITVIAGKETVVDFDGTYIGGYSDGAAMEALFNKPTGVLAISNGLLVVDTGNNVLRLINLTDKSVTTYAGTGDVGEADGYRTKASFNSPQEAVVADDGMIYVADTGNNCIRRIDTTGTVTTYTGFSHESGYKDGSLKEAVFNHPTGIAASGDSLYIADCGNQRIRCISDGKVTTLAGSGTERDVNSTEYIGGYRNGEALEAQFNYPSHIAVGEKDELYVTDTGNKAVRVIAEGMVTTLGGFGYYAGQKGFTWSGYFARPGYITYSKENGRLYVTDLFLNQVISFRID